MAVWLSNIYTRRIQLNYKSPLCSCIICHAVKSVKGISSHYISAHTKEGNAEAVKRGKMSQPFTQATNSKNRQSKVILYTNNPKYCKECWCCLSYDIRQYKFCSQSRAASFNNRERIANGYINSDKQRESAKQANKIKQHNKIIKESHPDFTSIFPCKVCGKFYPNKGSGAKTCSQKCRSIIYSTCAKNNPMLGGNKNTRAYGWYESPIAGKVWLESSYEVRVAR